MKKPQNILVISNDFCSASLLEQTQNPANLREQVTRQVVPQAAGLQTLYEYNFSEAIFKKQ